MSIRIVVALASLTFACSHAVRGTGDDDDSSPDAASADGSGASTCTPSAGFTAERLPSFDSGSWYDGSVLHVDATPHVLVSARSPTAHGSGVIDWKDTSAAWQRSAIGAIATDLEPGALAATAGGALCIAYRAYDGTLHLACDGASDRTIAPQLSGSLAIVRTAAITGLVFAGTDGAASGLVWQPFAGGFDAELAPPEPIDDRASLGIAAAAVDDAGDVHVAYSYESAGWHLVHAVRHAGAWTLEPVDDDTATAAGDPIPSSTVAIVIDNGQPAIAYGDRTLHRVRLARRTASGTFDIETLVATDPGFAHDSVGRSVALQHDCAGQLWVAYQRSISTDAANIGIAVARVAGDSLQDAQLLPSLEDSIGYSHSLGFYIAGDGRQYVSAGVLAGSIATAVPALYFASR